MKNPRLNKQGLTLLEVMLSIAILAILAVLASSSLFYPRYLVVNSGLEQSAIHAATAEIERHLNNYQNPVPRGQFNTDGWTFTTTTITNELSDPHNVFGGGIGDDADYLEISTSVTYRDGKTVDLITYRSLEVSSSQR